MIACAGCGYAAAPNAQCGYCGHVNGTGLAAQAAPTTGAAAYVPGQALVPAAPRYAPPPYGGAPAYYGSPMPGYPVLAPPKSRLAYILLGIFIGHLGIHNFYAGRAGAAVTQLMLTLLLFWTIVVPLGIMIWVIIEICTVKTDGKGRYMA